MPLLPRNGPEQNQMHCLLNKGRFGAFGVRLVQKDDSQAPFVKTKTNILGFTVVQED